MFADWILIAWQAHSEIQLTLKTPSARTNQISSIKISYILYFSVIINNTKLHEIYILLTTHLVMLCKRAYPTTPLSLSFSTWISCPRLERWDSKCFTYIYTSIKKARNIGIAERSTLRRNSIWLTTVLYRVIWERIHSDVIFDFLQHLHKYQPVH